MLEVFEGVCVFFFEDFCILSFSFYAVFVGFVVGNFIYEEEGEDFDAFFVELAFAFQVGGDGFSNLDSAEDIFAGFSTDFSGVEGEGCSKGDGVVPSVNAGYDESVSVGFEFSGFDVEVISFSDCSGGFDDVLSPFLEVSYRGSRVFVI